MQILYIINSYPGNGFSFQTRSKSINGQMSIECTIAGTKLFNLIHDVQYVIRVTCRENHE